MKIVVCIKQVPGTAQVEIDPETGVLKRDGVESKMNPYDLYALETALRFKQSYGAEITVVTMGPPQAESVIREAFMMGVDNGVILSDRRFGGSDVLATSYTLAQGIAAAAPYLISLILFAVLTLIPQLYMSRNQTGQQASTMRMTALIMTIMMLWVGWNLPAGVLLYYDVSTAWQVVQQIFITQRVIDKAKAEEEERLANAPIEVDVVRREHKARPRKKR